MDLAKRAAAADLLHAFSWRVDNGAGDRVAELFTEQATVVTPRFQLAGRAEIHAWFSERARVAGRTARHINTNLCFEEAGDRLRVNGYSLVTMQPAPGEDAQVAIGSTTDEIVFEDGKPLFAARRLDVVLQGRLEIDGAKP